ncbi:C40 family peptidase [Christiangramia aquimixticola]|uniref:C40 family peptidase n=1 Tax=Christiangramia aquimixticola TaxID=1697558 RepID=UPI003AA97714
MEQNTQRSVCRFVVLALTVMLLSSCGTRSKVITQKEDRSPRQSHRYEDLEKPEAVENVAEEIAANAKKFEGTKYKYGGTTESGMDCSGLVYVSFLEEGISLPRTSRDMSLQGRRLYLDEVTQGDLLFFETNKNRKVINHVGLVVAVNDEHIYFIHSSTSRGVIISSLSESFWKNNFVMARRVI